MMTFISCAKTMTARSKTPYPETTTPHFLKEARENALYMTQFTAEELAQMLTVNPKVNEIPIYIPGINKNKKPIKTTKPQKTDHTKSRIYYFIL